MGVLRIARRAAPEGAGVAGQDGASRIGPRRRTGARRRGLLGLVALALVGLAGALPAPGPAAAQTTVRIGSGGTVGSIRVTVGKSSTLQTDQSFVDLVVGDPEIADIMPLTDRSLYVLGKKIGTTSVSIYDADKKLVGVVEVEVAYNTGRLGAEIGRRVPGAQVEVSSVNGRIMLSGTVPNAVALDQVLAIAKQFGGPDVINSLGVASPQQVLLEVRFIEASRAAGRELGIRWDVAAKNFSAIAAGQLPLNSTPFGAILGRLISNGVQVDVLIEALETQGLARRLAEPNLVAMSGEKASFLAGGEFPFPVQGQNGIVYIEFKKFGVGLTFTPTVLANGLINLRIEPEVSQLDTSVTVQVGGVEVPSLIVRRASTTIELRDGQSFAIGGLLQSVNQSTKRQLPWIGEIPILGALFRSAAFERRETDLAIIVTPRLAKPAKPGRPPRTPLDTTAPGNDPEFFLLGKAEVPRAEFTSQGGLPAGTPAGHILDLRKKGERHVSAK